tara:strand:+ start:1046 stop:2296 length:1251 start_codon:yes stop_codon:yes gene_type:complete
MNNYLESKSQINDLLLSMTQLHPKYIDLSLDRLEKLLFKLGQPQKRLPPVVHIAGTNGKGSTLIFIKKIMEEYGLKIHCYTSPHLINFNERIVLAGKQIDNKLLLKLLKEVIKVNNNESITFFELTTAAALLSFSRKKADFCLIETGLGGRLDATNILKKKQLNIITSIGLDHEEFLSPYLKNIVAEKCGILDKNTAVVISKQNTYYKNSLLKNKVKDIKCEVLKLTHIPKNSKLGLQGKHQKKNAKTAVTAVRYLLKGISNNIIKKGINKAVWPGRIQEITLKENFKKRLNKTFIDGAHNLEGAKIINDYLNELNLGKWNFIFGMINNKNPIKFLEIIENHIEKIIFVPINNQKNSFDPQELHQLFKKKPFISKSENNLKNAIEKTSKKKPLFITGSLYLMGEFLKLNSENEIIY